MFSSYLYNKMMFTKNKILIKGPIYLLFLYFLKNNITFNIIYRLIYIFSIITGSTFISTFIVSKFITNKFLLNNDSEEDDEEDNEYTRYIEFINDNYETFNNILSNETTTKEYTNNNKKNIKSLKNIENHHTNELPYLHNDKIIIFYDDTIEGYLYYTKSDVNYKVLNAVCRNYVITKKFINLFTDNEELTYIKNYNLEEDESEKDTENEGENDDEGENNDEGENEDEDEEESNGFINIFYSKKKKIKLLKNVKQNKFIYKGNIIEYEKIYKINNDDVKNISYNNYKNK